VRSNPSVKTPIATPKKPIFLRVSATYLFGFLELDVRIPLSFLLMAAGLLTFFMAVLAWIFGKMKRKEIIDFWIYRFSRHPQYLGFLLWSYGVMLLATFTPFPRGGYFPEPSFPWLVSALIVFCGCLEGGNSK
jgi:protein-S-isoprenylcysteine O-methyltransferase Ste14